MEENKIRYVVGFLFSKDKSKVLLIRKDKPSWQVGKFNGIGGSIKEGEGSLQAIKRKCQDEAALFVDNWNLKGTIFGDTYYVDIYIAETSVDNMLLAESLPKLAEPCKVFDLNELDRVQTIPQLKWLIPMVLDKDIVTIQIKQK